MDDSLDAARDAVDAYLADRPARFILGAGTAQMMREAGTDVSVGQMVTLSTDGRVYPTGEITSVARALIVDDPLGATPSTPESRAAVEEWWTRALLPRGGLYSQRLQRRATERAGRALVSWLIARARAGRGAQPLP